MNKFYLVFIISFLSFAGISKADGHKPDIVETAVAAGSFNTLVKAVTAAELVQTLKGKGPFTVFAPSDEAFSTLDSDLLADLLKPENKNTLTGILTFHVLSGKVMSTSVASIWSVARLQPKWRLSIVVNKMQSFGNPDGAMIS